jgi:uncharacterized protein (DUF983 family)
MVQPGRPASNASSKLGAKRAAILLGRALLRRCPNCGYRPIFVSFFKMMPGCPGCGLRFERAESDYFLGAYLFNFVAVEMLFAVMLVVVMVATWPNPPWELLQWGGLALVLLGAVICYPLSKTVWLAFDLMLRPLSPEELQWHREGKLAQDRELPHL